MLFLDKRIGVICNELNRLSVRQREPVTDWMIKPGAYLTPEEADRAPESYEAFDSRRAQWYGPDAHVWFTAQATVPASFAGRSLWLNIGTQLENQWQVLPARRRREVRGRR